MMWSISALIIGFVIDLIIGDPPNLPHPIVWLGKLIAALDKRFRKIFPPTAQGEKSAGILLWLIVVSVAFLVPTFVLWIFGQINPWLAFAAESIMCWQILAVKSLRTEAMKVYAALKAANITQARYAISMIVGRDTQNLDATAITKAAIETVAENTSDGVVAPLLFMAIGGAPAGFFYKAVNTMDSMLGYIEPPYKNIGFAAAKMDDVMNFIPARVAALLMLAAGKICGLNIQNGWRIFQRDRYKHASPNSAQTESVCAGLLGIQLAGPAYYHGSLHKKPYIGDALRPISYNDIPLTCSLMTATAALALLTSCLIRLLILL